MRRWRRPRTVFPAPRPVRFWPKRRRRSAGTLRTLLLGLVALLIWPTLDPALIDPPAFLSTAPETVDLRFGRCGVARGHACVVDGDTFRIGQRRIRIVEIDAPELAGRCQSERDLAEAATVKLQALLNEGPFVMRGRIDRPRDRYGRELRSVSRQRPDGSTQSIAAELRGAGLARRYLGRKASWC